jgi:transposase-like protein DUF772
VTQAARDVEVGRSVPGQARSDHQPQARAVRLAAEIDWSWIDREIAPLYSEQGRPAVPTRFMTGLLLLKHIYVLSDEEVCQRWVENPRPRASRRR